MNINKSTKPQPKRVVLVDLRYPYGKSKIYMSGSLYATAARLMAIGHTVEIVDLNIDSLQDNRVKRLFRSAHVIGVSVIGSPYIPSAIKFAKMISSDYPLVRLIFGGQVIESLYREEFATLFAGTNAIQIIHDSDLVGVLLDRVSDNLPSAFTVPFCHVWQQMGDKRLRLYLENEFTLVVAQGCIYKCAFCAAKKGQREILVESANFREDLLFLCAAAKRFGLTKLECYATSLDLFQNPLEIQERLWVLAEVQKETGVQIKVRCLSCMGSFLKAHVKIPDLESLLRCAGLWCIGFGVDGTDEAVWRAEHKTQNHLNDVKLCLDLCQKMSVRAEILMVLGFQEDTRQTLWKNVKNSFRYCTTWRNTVIRPYLAKRFVPGNEGWKTEQAEVEATIVKPNRFYDLDFCAFGSPLTHPRRLHRWMCNLAYFTIVTSLSPFGKCPTSPLLPQGNNSFLARFANRHMPFDR